MKVAFNKMKNAVAELGEVIIPVLSRAAEWITRVVDKIAGMDDRTKSQLLSLALQQQ